MFQNIAGMFGVPIATAVFGDVKPANILVDARAGRPDHVYLSDFGVSEGAVSSVSLTGTGQFLGTPDYSAPEQIQAGPWTGGPISTRWPAWPTSC
jgi:serine/threonine protein kinase